MNHSMPRVVAVWEVHPRKASSIVSLMVQASSHQVLLVFERLLLSRHPLPELCLIVDHDLGVPVECRVRSSWQRFEFPRRRPELRHGCPRRGLIPIARSRCAIPPARARRRELRHAFHLAEHSVHIDPMRLAEELGRFPIGATSQQARARGNDERDHTDLEQVQSRCVGEQVVEEPQPVVTGQHFAESAAEQGPSVRERPDGELAQVSRELAVGPLQHELHGREDRHRRLREGHEESRAPVEEESHCRLESPEVILRGRRPDNNKNTNNKRRRRGVAISMGR